MTDEESKIMAGINQKPAAPWYLSKRYWAVFFMLVTVVLPELPTCGLTPWIPAIMKGCAFMAAALAGYSKFSEPKP